MESDLFPANPCHTINLDNYFPHRRSYNTVIYVHKKFLKNFKKDNKNEKTKKKREVKGKGKEKNLKKDKGVNCYIREEKTKREGLHDESIVNQTIRFAKNLAHQVIPPSENNDVVYHVKTCNRCKKFEKSCPESKYTKNDDIAYNKKRSKKIIETYKKEEPCHRENSSARDSISHSSESNTLDDLKLNPSLSYTLSNGSTDKGHKKRANYTRKRQSTEKFAISESFEGLATEINNFGDAKLKIHLMTEKEKDYLTEKIRIPVVNAVKDCIAELYNVDMRDEMKYVHRSVNINTQKLDTIIDKLTCIEKYFVNNSNKLNSPKVKNVKASRLEQLGEDLTDKRYSSEEELATIDSNRQRNEVTKLEQVDNRVENLGCGELATKASTSVGVRTNRLPARFCWTDAKM